MDKDSSGQDVLQNSMSKSDIAADLMFRTQCLIKVNGINHVTAPQSSV